MRRLIVLLLLLLTACTTAPVTCPVCVQQPAINSSLDTIDYLYTYFIDVGQGDSELIKYKDTEMIIDCGKNAEGPKLVDMLDSMNIENIEYMVITHPDSDHSGGCDDILSHKKVNTVILNGQKSDNPAYVEVLQEIDTEQVINAEEGYNWNIGPAEITVLQVNNTEDPNQNSIVMKLKYGNNTILFTGDCDNGCEQNLLDKDIQAKILKVAHHGSKYGTSLKFLQIVKPTAAIISVGDNSYGHPTQETLDRLSQQGIPVFRTDYEGTIVVKMDDKGYTFVK